MIEAEHLTHHQQTLRSWEAMGEKLVVSAYSEAERRKCPRFLAPEVVIQLDVSAAGREQTTEVTVHDVCATGACLLSPTALPVSVKVKLRPLAEHRHEIDTVDAIVTFCRKKAEHCRIGVKFCDTV